MKEIIAAFIGAVVGAFLACMFSFWQRNAEKWKTFQEELGAIKAKR